MDTFVTAIYPILDLLSVFFVFAIGVVIIVIVAFFVIDIRQSKDAVLRRKNQLRYQVDRAFVRRSTSTSTCVATQALPDCATGFDLGAYVRTTTRTRNTEPVSDLKPFWRIYYDYD